MTRRFVSSSADPSFIRLERISTARRRHITGERSGTRQKAGVLSGGQGDQDASRDEERGREETVVGLSGADHFYRARVVRMVFMHVHGE